MSPALSPECHPWDALTAEFDAWAATGQQARLWWRDDDAVRPGPALDRLIGLSTDYNAPVYLAVIPAHTGDELARYLRDKPKVSIAQHGYRHDNHAATGQKKIELGGGRRVDQVADDLMAGRAIMERYFGVAPVMLVPPWNRIDPAVIDQLPALGFKTISCFANAPPHDGLPAGLSRLNTHLDPIAWRGDRGFVGASAALAPLVAHLQTQRLGQAVPESAGLLTHHMDHNAAVWQFIEALIRRVADHPGACWVSAA